MFPYATWKGQKMDIAKFRFISPLVYFLMYEMFVYFTFYRDTKIDGYVVWYNICSSLLSRSQRMVETTVNALTYVDLNTYVFSFPYKNVYQIFDI